MRTKKSSNKLKYSALILLALTGFWGLENYKIVNKKNYKQLVAKQQDPNSWMLNERIQGVMIHDTSDNMIIINPRDTAVSTWILTKGYWEDHITTLMNKIIKPGDKVVSLGAHIGYHIVQMSKLVGTHGKVFTFEPNPETLVRLEQNIAINNNKNVEVIDKAAYSEKGELRFAAINIDRSNTGHSYVITDKNAIEQNVTQITVQAVKIDDQLKDLPAMNILQMDIEGSEINAVKGATALIDRSPNLIVLQEWTPEMMSAHSDVAEYVKFWRDRGYQIAKIKVDGIEPLTDEQLVDPKINCDVVMAKDLQPIQELYTTKL